jgi:hypothetical protein
LYQEKSGNPGPEYAKLGLINGAVLYESNVEQKTVRFLLRFFPTAIRVARWFVFKPKIPIWVNFGASCNGKSWYIL